MGVYIDYCLSAEGDDDEIVSRLERVRQRCLDLPLKSVGKVQRVDPVYNFMTLSLYQKEGYKLPPEIKSRFDAAEAKRDSALSISFGFLLAYGLPEEMQLRYIAPAMEYADRAPLWNPDEMPDEISQSVLGFKTFTVNRYGIEIEFANVILRYGYVLLLDPGDGCETVSLGMAAYSKMEGSSLTEPALWHGNSFTKTQYAKNFILAHETICKILDVVKEEGLLYSGGDTCGYYEDRNWDAASKVVNEELAFAEIMGGALSHEIGNLREEGVPVQMIQDNASKAKQVDFSSRIKPSKKRANDSLDSNSG